MGELKEINLCCTGPGPHLLPKDLCSVTSSMCSTCLIFLSVSLPVSPSLTPCLLSPGPFSSPPLPESLGMWSRTVILCTLRLKVTASASVSLSSLPFVSLHLLWLCPVMLPLPLAQSHCHCVCLSHPPGPCSGPTVLHFLSCSLFLCLWFLSLFLLGDITKVLEFGTLAVLGSVRAPGCM